MVTTLHHHHGGGGGGGGMKERNRPSLLLSYINKFTVILNLSLGVMDILGRDGKRKLWWSRLLLHHFFFSSAEKLIFWGDI